MEFTNSLSDPIIVLNSMGEVCAKNHAFEKHISSIDLNLLSFDELSALLAKALRNSEFPLHADAQSYQATIEDSSGKEHIVYLHPNVFAKTHLIIFEQFDSENILQKVLDCIPARVFWKDLNGSYLGGNHLFISDCGVSSREELVGLNDYNCFNKSEADNFVKDDRLVMSTGKPRLNIEEPQTRKNGEVKWLETSKVPIRNHAQEIIGLMGSYTDITDRRLYQELLEGQARRDELTKLHNRQALQDYIKNLEKDHERKTGSLLFIDLDNFKTANDTLGHAVGDQLLQAVADRLVDISNEQDFVARLGGDEFSILLMSDNQVSKEQLTKQTIDFARDIKQAILEPYQLGSHNIQLGVSIGITYFDSVTVNWSEIFKEADLAMYEAKAAGKNTTKTFREEIRSERDRIYQMQTLLNLALEKKGTLLKHPTSIRCQFSYYWRRDPAALEQ